MSKSPRITHISWGRMEVEGIGPGKDYKVYPGRWARVGLGRDRHSARSRHPAR